MASSNAMGRVSAHWSKYHFRNLLKNKSQLRGQELSVGGLAAGSVGLPLNGVLFDRYSLPRANRFMVELDLLLTFGVLWW